MFIVHLYTENVFPSPIQPKEKKYPTAKIKIYSSELEHQKDFNGFTEWLQTFHLYKKPGKEGIEDESESVGKFKVIKLVNGTFWQRNHATSDVHLF